MLPDDHATTDSSWAVLISSFDGNSDLWPIFFHYFFQQWPDAPAPVYLVTNFKRYDDPRVLSLCVGRDTDWGSVITASLASIQARYVWMLLDDFFLDRPVLTGRVEEVVGQIASRNGVYLETGRQSDDGPLVESTDLRRIPASNPIAGINSAIYSRQLLLELAKPGNSIWDGNRVMNAMNVAGSPDLYYLREGVPPLISFVEAVKGRFWKPVAIEFMKRTGVTPDLNWRPFPPQGQDPFSKMVRSFHKRRMDWRKSREEKHFAAGRVHEVVRPLEKNS
ncbi:hypothetical protein [Prosthecobacter sp.]|jgi:hypothetical protein|uniref:hypothetical protein n=1 Tax=Prosthecobacter sp. TaxID=1965333 RepID=UPI003783B907